MNNILTDLRSSTIVSFLLVFPLFIMELVNRHSFFISGKEDFPIVLFILMLSLPMLFVVILMPVVRTLRAGNSLLANPFVLLLRVVLLTGIAWVWVSGVIDQLPCFLGVMNCD